MIPIHLYSKKLHTLYSITVNIFRRKKLLVFCSFFVAGIYHANAQNSAITFNGSTQYITTTQYIVPYSGDFTVELWVNATAGGLRHFVSQGSAGSAFFIGMSATSKIWLGDTWPATTIDMPLNQWTHLAVVRSGTTGNLYINGVLSATSANYTITNNAGTKFYIGKQYSTINEYTAGSIDEVRVWKTARTAAQIKDGMYNDVPVNSANLLAYYKLNEGSGSATSNYSTSADAIASSNGTLINTPSWLAISPIQKNFNAAHFDGANDFAHYPSSTAYDFTTGTVECWIRTENLVGNACIIGNRTTPNTRWSFHISTTNIGMWNTLTYATIPFTVVPGQWYHMAFVMTPTTTTVYVNGVSKGTTGNVMNTGKSNLQLQIGVADFENVFEHFSGSIDDVRIWNVARTQTEIQNNMNSELTGSETNLIGYWNFNQGVAGGNNTALIKVIDQTTNNRHLQLYNMGLLTNASNWVSHSTAVLNPPPVITSFTPAYGAAGTSIAISGNNFNTTPANNTVYFGATKATVTASTTTSLTVTAPAGSTYKPISVRNGTYALTGYAKSSFFSTFSGGGGSPAFDPKVDFTAGTNPKGITLGDIDGDGKSDMIVVNRGSNTISIYRNTATSGTITSGSFSAKVDFATVTSPYHVDIVDVDGDGKLDIAVTNTGTASVSVFRNNATSGIINSSSLDTRVDFALSGAPKAITFADINGDGKPELITAGANGIAVVPNSATSGSISSGSFGTPVYLASGNAFQSVIAGDVDGDGKADIIAGGDATGILSILQNSYSTGVIATTSFSSKIDFSISTNNPENIAIGDLDADNKPDIVVANSAENSVSVFHNVNVLSILSIASLETQVKYNVSTSPSSVAITDVTGDGKPDIAISNSSTNTVSVLRNISTAGIINASSFSGKYDFTTGTAPGAIAAGDIDGDGKPDLVLANLNSGNASVLRNITNTTLPLSLLLFNGIISHDDVLLNWKTDNEVNTLSFDIERSTDGSHFVPADNINAANTPGVHQYTFTDVNAAATASVLYYRLKQKDLDGKFVYSAVIKLLSTTKSNAVQLYPTVVSEQATLSISLSTAQQVRLTVIDNTGRIVQRSYHTINAGSNILLFNPGHLTPGIYFLDINGKTITDIKRFIKR